MNHAINKALLVKLAGERVFELGEAVFKQSRIEKLEQSKDWVKAEIDAFRLSVRIGSNTIEGACSCPRSDQFDFCEHCVALCLHLNELAHQRMALSSGPERSQILAYLLSLDSLELAKTALELIESDTESKERFRLRAWFHQTDLDYKALKKHVTEMTRKPENLFSQKQFNSFLKPIECLLEELSTASARHVEPGIWSLLNHVIKRLSTLFSQIDASMYANFDTRALNTLCASVMTKQNAESSLLSASLFELWLLDAFDLLADSISQLDQQEWCNFLLVQWRSQKTPLKASEKLARACYSASHSDLKDEEKIGLLSAFARYPEELRTLIALYEKLGKRDEALLIAQRLLASNHEQRDLEKVAYLLTMPPQYEPQLGELFRQHPEKLFDFMMHHEPIRANPVIMNQVGDFLAKECQKLPNVYAQFLIETRQFEALCDLIKKNGLSLNSLRLVVDIDASEAINSIFLATRYLVEICLGKNMSKYTFEAVDALVSLKSKLGNESDAFLNYYDQLSERHRHNTAFLKRLYQALADS